MSEVPLISLGFVILCIYCCFVIDVWVTVTPETTKEPEHITSWLEQNTIIILWLNYVIVWEGQLPIILTTSQLNFMADEVNHWGWQTPSREHENLDGSTFQMWSRGTKSELIKRLFVNSRLLPGNQDSAEEWGQILWEKGNRFCLSFPSFSLTQPMLFSAINVFLLCPVSWIRLCHASAPENWFLRLFYPLLLTLSTQFTIEASTNCPSDSCLYKSPRVD